LRFALGGASVEQWSGVKLEIQLGGRKRAVELMHRDSKLACTLDGAEVALDPVQVAEGTYSILLEGQSYEVRVYPAPDGLHITSGGEEFVARVRDPRSLARGRGGALEAEGPQQIVAPMPGKVVRMLVKAGDNVEAGQGLLVVEAMKMQNEIRSPKSGTVERVAAAEGQSVNAGEVLIVVS
jgi:biotin carboxyl carrier protein